MKFGFDIDDTLINLREYAFHLYNKKLNQSIALDVFQSLKTVEIHEAFGLKKEVGNKMWTDSMEEIYFTDCPAFEGAIETLQQLKKDGHEIFYITSRPKKYCTQTREWIKAQGFPVEDNHFYCGMEDNEKIATIKELALDYYFDDKPAVLETLSDVTTKVYIMDQSYNQHVNLPRMKQWSELEKIMIK
ncbi:HAD family acid phosphatase [Psychrobacillus sp. FSL H8-0484]|uniref:5' nucleotidase, NT5C type n=1 Tax=Psychrobacillus sp. FSL H8-0484 TaxID=2921390 RepID=UPI0030F530F6